MKTTILIIINEEDPFRTKLARHLLEKGWHVAFAATNEEAILFLDTQKIDAVVMDASGTSGDLPSQLTRIRQNTRVPILCLLGQEERNFTECELIESGADDCLRRPMDEATVAAHLTSLMRRFTMFPLHNLSFPNFQISIERHTVEVDGKRVSLTPREFDLLYMLANHANFVLSREQILNSIWEWDYTGDARTVDTHIKILRAKLGWVGRHIVTVRKVGYKFAWEQRQPAYIELSKAAEATAFL